MTGLFMFLLFLLNILTIFAVIIVFMRQNRLKQVEKDQKALVSQMEELMTSYIAEMKEDHEALLAKLVDKKPQRASSQKTDVMKKDVTDFEEQNRASLL